MRPQPQRVFTGPSPTRILSVRVPLAIGTALRLHADLADQTLSDIVTIAAFAYLTRVAAEAQAVPPSTAETLAAAQAAEVVRLTREVAPHMFSSYGARAYGPADLRPAADALLHNGGVSHVE